MIRRSLYIYGILLLCVFLGACNKMESSDVLITQDHNINIDKDETLYEDINMDINETLNEDTNMDISKVEETLVEIMNKQIETIEQVKPIESLNPEEIKEQCRAYPAGTVISTTDFDQEILDSLFYIEELSHETIDRITGKSYKEDSDIPYSDLRYIRLLHKGFDGSTYIGEMIVNSAIAEDVVEIFRELYAIEYPIEKMLLIDEYGADDLQSMADNNSSAFNYRLVEGTTRRSVHSDGLAIDINPLYNPYVRTRDGVLEVLPENATEYVDRTKENIYYIRKDDPCYNAFVSRGFTWGGEWNNSKDYQHFEKKSTE